MKTQLINNIVNTASNFQPVMADVQSSIVDYLKWFLVVAGGLMALVGFIQFMMSGRQGDSTGKVEGAWLLAAGLGVMGFGAIVALIITAPPAAK
ncbi:hypothetical protein RyT2_17240 [Pseudolactococcus yaeyamensis]